MSSVNLSEPDMLGKLLKGLGALFVLFLILAGPSGLFWVQWMMPGNAYPADIDTQVRTTGTAPPDLTSRLEQILVERRREGGGPSLSAAVARDGTVLWAGAVGYADLAAGTAATPDVLYRLGSSSKALTGTLLGRLLDAEAIDLDATVGALAPELPEHLHAITVRQLASHTGGVRHYARMPTWLPADNESITPHHYASVEEGLELFADDALTFEPGTGFGYSTFGYSLLSHLMERATGSDFATLLETHLDGPVGTDLRLDDLTVAMPDRAAPHTTGKGRWGPAWPSDPVKLLILINTL